jgi:4-amino-4-deoxy-L-arabinose transferase-like glycosyltransferase
MRKWTRISLIVCSAALFWLVFLTGDRKTQFGDFGLMYVQVEQIIRQDYKSLAFDYPARAYDPDFEFVPFRFPYFGKVGSQHYVHFPPYFPLMHAPLYQLLGSTGLYIPGFLATLGTLILVVRMGQRLGLPDPLTALIPPVFLLASRLLLYNIVFHEYTIAVFIVTTGLWFFMKGMDGNARGFVWFGFFMGLALIFRLEFLGIIAGFSLVAVWLLRSWVRTPWLIGLGAAAPVLALAAANTYLHGHPLGLRYTLTMDVSAAYSHADILRDMLFSTVRGIVPQSPHLLLSFAWILFARTTLEKSLGLGWVASFVILLIIAPNAGDHMAPRYLFGLFPIGTVLAVAVLARGGLASSRPRQVAAAVVFAALCFWSVRSTLSGLKFYDNARREIREMNVLLEQTQGVLVFSDVRMAMNLQNSFANRPLLVAETPELMSKLNRTLQAQDVTLVALNQNLRSGCDAGPAPVELARYKTIRVCHQKYISVAQLTRSPTQ